jgi:hypothetical protein
MKLATDRGIISAKLENDELFFVCWTGFASFTAYFSMYLLRKPFTAGAFNQQFFFGIDYKIALVIAQVIGYAFSKFAGIKIIAELHPAKRVRMFLLFFSVAWLALLGFSLTPPAWGPAWLFINGLPLGMIWGIVFTYCEGRRMTEVITLLLPATRDFL